MSDTIDWTKPVEAVHTFTSKAWPCEVYAADLRGEKAVLLAVKATRADYSFRLGLTDTTVGVWTFRNAPPPKETRWVVVVQSGFGREVAHLFRCEKTASTFAADSADIGHTVRAITPIEVEGRAE